MHASGSVVNTYANVGLKKFDFAQEVGEEKHHVSNDLPITVAFKPNQLPRSSFPSTTKMTKTAATSPTKEYPFPMAVKACKSPQFGKALSPRNYQHEVMMRADLGMLQPKMTETSGEKTVLEDDPRYINAGKVKNMPIVIKGKDNGRKKSKRRPSAAGVNVLRRNGTVGYLKPVKSMAIGLPSQTAANLIAKPVITKKLHVKKSPWQ